MRSVSLPLWLRVVLLLGIVVLGTGAGLFAYRYYEHPTTLTVAVGSIDGEAAKAMSAIASRLVSTNASIRLEVVDTGTALEAAKAFSDKKVDLAVVRGDVGDLSKAQAVVVMSHVVALVIAPPGSSIDSMDKLKGRRVGVLGGDANTKIVDVLSKEYGLDREKVFRDIALPDARQVIQSKEVSALLVVIPMAGKYLSMVRDIFQQGPKALPTLIEIEFAGAIAEAERYNSTTQSFMDEYGNWIYLTPMILGGMATVLAAGWKFLGVGQSETEGPLDTLYALARRIRRAGTEGELSDIEDEIDSILQAQRAKVAAGDENAVDATTLNVAAHRLENLIHDRRAILMEKPAVALVRTEESGKPVDATGATRANIR